MKINSLDELSSAAVAAIEDHGPLTNDEVEEGGALDGDTLALFVWREVRDAFRGEPLTQAVIDEAHDRITVAIRELCAVQAALEQLTV